MYKQIELFCEPRMILSKIQDAYCEMSDFEHGFICGLIRDVHPEKVVEIGVACGGTTAVIMNCLSMLESNAQMYSVDINKQCYRRSEKKCGYQLKEVEKYLPNYANHKFLLGSILPNVIEKIGGGIDFVVLDTVHRLPGELLDFLCIVPYLNDGAVVVLHDVTSNMFRDERAYATKIVFDTAFGDKYFNYENGILNIGAIRIGKETKENIANVFSAFSITWAYMPPRAELLTYRKVYRTMYSDECLKLFDIFVKAQIERTKKSKHKDTMRESLTRFKDQLLGRRDMC